VVYRLGCCFELVAQCTAPRFELRPLSLVPVEFGADGRDAVAALLEQRQRLLVGLIDAAEDVAATQEPQSQPGELLEQLALRHVDLEQLIVGCTEVDIELPGALLLVLDGFRYGVEGCAPAHLSHWYTPFHSLWASP